MGVDQGRGKGTSAGRGLAPRFALCACLAAPLAQPQGGDTTVHFTGDYEENPLQVPWASNAPCHQVLTCNFSPPIAAVQPQPVTLGMETAVVIMHAVGAKLRSEVVWLARAPCRVCLCALPFSASVHVQITKHP